MKTVLRGSSGSKVYGGSVKTKITGRLKTVLRGSPDENNFRILENDDIRALENGDLRILE